MSVLLKCCQVNFFGLKGIIYTIYVQSFRQDNICTKLFWFFFNSNSEIDCTLHI